MKEKIVIFGTGQNSEIAYYYLNKDSTKKIYAFTVDRKFIKNKKFQNLPVVSFEDLPSLYPPDKFKLFIPISFKEINKLRMNKYYEAKKNGYSFANYISPNASVLTNDIGENCLILENNTIQPFVKIGNNVIIWSGNHIGHHSSIGDHAFISSHVVISGAVTIEENVFIGVNATIRDNITIGKFSVIGAGSVIDKTIPDESVTKAPKTIIAGFKSSKLKNI